MMKIFLSIIIVIISTYFIYSQPVSSFTNTNGPFNREISAYLSFSDSIILISKRDIGLFRSSDSGTTWSKIVNGIPLNKNILSMARHPSGILFISTANGGVLRSLDGGVSWQLTPSTQLGIVKSLFVKANGLIYAGTQSSGLFRSSNSGYSWSQLFYNYDINSMTESTSGNLFAHMTGSVYRSTNDGISWQFLTWMSDDDALVADNFNAVYLVRSYVYRSFDQGNTWQSILWQNNLNSLLVTSDSIIFVGMTGYDAIKRSTNYGASFSYYSLYGKNVQKLFVLGDQYLFASCPDGLFKNNFRISNNFVQVDLNIEQPKIISLLPSLYVNSIIAVCDFGGIYRFHNNYWQKLFDDFPPATGITAGYVGITTHLLGTRNKGLWRSSDNGVNWTQLDIFPHINSNIISIKNIQSSLFFCATKYDGIYVSTNSGLNWRSSRSGLPETFVVGDMDLSSNGVCYLSLLNEGVYFSLDSCKTWHSRSNGLPVNSSLKSLTVRANCILGAANDDKIYLTTDFGANWNEVTNGVPGALSNPVLKYHSSGLAFLASGRNIYRSTDFGVNWVLNYTVPQGVKILSLAFDPYSVLYAGCDNGFVYKSSNYIIPVELTSFVISEINNVILINWSTASELNNLGFELERSINKNDWIKIGFKEGKGTTTEQQNYSYTDDVSGINVPKLYYRLKQIDFDGSYEYSDVVEVTLTPMKFTLSHNYPNPFNPSTKISWQSPVGSWQTLKVYDVLGREVATLVDEYRDAGSYEIEFQSAAGNGSSKGVPSGLASGIYYYQLRIEDFVETKKMLMLK